MAGNEMWFSEQSGSFITLGVCDENQLLHSINDINSFKIPAVFLNEGLLLSKISHSSFKRVKLKVQPSNFKFVYELPKGKIYEFLVDDIRGLYFGEPASRYREEFGVSKEFEKQWISISFFNQSKSKLKTLHLIADTVYDFRRVKALFVGFKRLRDDISESFLLNLSDLHATTRSMVVKKAVRSNEMRRDSLSLPDVVKFTKRMNVNLSEALIIETFLKANGDRTSPADKLSFEQFKSFVSILNKRSDLDQLWATLCDENREMSFLAFKHFMIFVQNEHYDELSLSKLFAKFDTNDKGFWNIHDFNAFLYSKVSSPIMDHSICDDYFSRPLNEYFILSSHNTYLMGRQVLGESSVEGYIKALQRGCRCLEIDIWNSKNAGPEPLVNHGRTFTSGISLRNVAKTIRSYAFQATTLPLIISIENHCSHESQREAVSIFKDVFGDLLLSERLDDTNRLPSPAMLRNKILLKVKKSDFSLPGSDGNMPMDSTTSTSTTTTSLSESTESTGSNFTSKLRKRTSTKSVIKALSDLAVYIQGVRFRNFSLPESKAFNHCFSLSEKAVDAMLKDSNKKVSLDKHNRSYLMRIYPSKFRLRSSNFNPTTYWRYGIQMVATNWQTYDLGQQLNEAMFNVPSGHGYILKPQYLRTSITKGKESADSRKPKYRKNLKVTIISAHQLPNPVGSTETTNPFVTLELIGAENVRWDSNKARTRIIDGNGHNPIWNQTFNSCFEAGSDFVFLRLTVSSGSSCETGSEYKDVALTISNIFSLKNGYRYLMLRDMCGEQLLYSSIFVNIYIADEPD